MKRLLFLALLPALGCHPPAPSKPLTPQEAYGRQVFGALCANCHYADSEEGLTGPGLQGLFRKKYLPSGGAVQRMPGDNIDPASFNSQTGRNP